VTGPSCTTETSCWAVSFSYVDRVSRSWHFDGRTWTTAKKIAARQQIDISCWAPDGCRTVDRAAGIHALTGGTWHTTRPFPRSGYPTDVSCASVEMCVLVDRAGSAVRFDGTQWQPAESIDPHRIIESVSCPTTTFCMALDIGGYAVRFSRGRWHSPTQVFDIAGLQQRVDVSCATQTFCGAVTEGGLAATFTDGRWQASRRITSASMLAISCPASNHCVAATTDGVVVYKGGWAHPSAAGHYFDAVSCVVRFCAIASREVWMRNDGVLAIGVPRNDVPGPINLVCATRHFCLISQVGQKNPGSAVDGASAAAAGIPASYDRTFRAGDCTASFCMLLVGGDPLEETHASR
jgi:hypothetical protein